MIDFLYTNSLLIIFGPLFIGAYRLEADQAISLADLMDIGSDRLELVASKGAAE